MEKLKDILNNSNIYLAHTHKDKQDETLEEHLDLTFSYYKKLNKEKNIEKILDRGLNEFYINKKNKESFLSREGKNMVKNLFHKAIYYHDLGKINPSFQKIKMKNKEFNNIKATNDTTHGLLSSLMYIDIFYDEIKNMNLDKYEKNVLRIFLISFSYSISRHHSYLMNLDEYREKLQTLVRDMEYDNDKVMNYIYTERIIKREDTFEKNTFKKLMDNINQYIKSGDVFFLINKLLYSLIIACDYYATSDYMNEEIKDFGQIKNMDIVYENFNNSPILKGIRKYEKFRNGKDEECPFEKDSINSVRSEIFLESEKSLLNNMGENIFYLEAPTGSGKTINSLNLGLNLLKHNKLDRLFYVFPFNTLCDQTYDVVSEYFDKKDMAILNSIKPIKIDKEEILDYDKSYLDRLFIHYPCILTSHVNFFNYLFSNGREIQIPLIHICNSVVILDEIQSYKVSIWKELANMLDLYSKILNIKFIIMSATLPKISKLCENLNMGVSLIKDSSIYFSNPKFKDRVNLDYSLLDKGKLKVEEVANEFIKYREKLGQKRILIEFIKKKSAREFYDRLKENSLFKDKLFELTGDDNALVRKDLLSRLKEKKDDKYVLDDVIVVCTQVIEAGVDIDMDIGFKDISILEAEEQFLGRINRSSTKYDSKVYFFHCDDEKSVYRDDYRTEFSLIEESYRYILNNKNFDKYYDEVLNIVDKRKKEYNENSYEIYKNNLKYLEYMKLCESLKLIKDKTYSVFIAHKLKNPMTDEIIDGKEIWTKFKEILLDMHMAYTEKQIKLSQIKEVMNYFIYSVYEELNYSDDEQIEDMYYIEDGEKYFKDGKFHRILFEEEMIPQKGDIFI
ncbi:MAG: CRISPR-associated helicase Cas3' [Anaeromicrobium sp.]|jgi:CRISPR-associated endonuclease/helicase Cas3|uniref:CRISPR-associated helicase Cas3' n=1 Tax=Anaeromicrobium sp. TaxID=1929132 RepID=UPI0025EE04F0|nr:CRISPR-associated helicase Cas3' [Anaeromicrobium sp.]MCT4594809.1 CRISPR-associated helicase Cas3' [Anaeromicrobium sp.]